MSSPRPTPHDLRHQAFDASGRCRRETPIPGSPSSHRCPQQAAPGDTLCIAHQANETGQSHPPKEHPHAHAG